MQAYLARIREVNLHGPALRAIIEVNPFAVDQADDLDHERRKYGSRGRLHGIPIILKDNIATDYEDYGSAVSVSHTFLAFITSYRSEHDSWFICLAGVYSTSECICRGST